MPPGATLAMLDVLVMVKAEAVALTVAGGRAAPPAAVRCVLLIEALLVTTVPATALVCTSTYNVPELPPAKLAAVNVFVPVAPAASATSTRALPTLACPLSDIATAGVFTRISGPLATYRLPAAVVEAGKVSVSVMVCAAASGLV